MALKQSLQQRLLQKLSPQQIQLMKMLQLPTVELEKRIKEELEINPALEEGEEQIQDADHEEGVDEKVDFFSCFQPTHHTSRCQTVCVRFPRFGDNWVRV